MVVDDCVIVVDAEEEWWVGRDKGRVAGEVLRRTTVAADGWGSWAKGAGLLEERIVGGREGRSKTGNEAMVGVPTLWARGTVVAAAVGGATTVAVSAG